MQWIEIWDEGPKQDVQLDIFPKTCPYCNLQINAEFRHGSFFHRGVCDPQPPEETWIDAVFKCPSQDCSRLFIASYIRVHGSEIFCFHETIPLARHTRSFDDFMKEVSPRFCNIWNEAHQAEQAGLTEICGMGFRKALEFLIKDYLIRQKPEEEENILKKFLGKCISEHVDHPKIKDCANRAVWLGNDETHYLRKWEGKDVKDLKILIDLTVHWMEMQHLTDHYKDDMQE